MAGFSSLWTKSLLGNEDDNYYLYKERITCNLENIISSVTNDILTAGDGKFDSISAKKTAVTLVAKALNKVQYTETPEEMTAMVYSLFLDLPEMKNNQEKVYYAIENNIHSFRLVFLLVSRLCKSMWKGINKILKLTINKILKLTVK